MKWPIVLFINFFLITASFAADPSPKQVSKAKRRDLPTIDKKKMAQIKKRLKKRKMTKLKENRREISQNVSKSVKASKRKRKRSKRLILLRAARNRLNLASP